MQNLMCRINLEVIQIVLSPAILYNDHCAFFSAYWGNESLSSFIL